MLSRLYAKADFRGSRAFPIFEITLKNYKLLFEAELIINNAPLTYVYPNTIETCLTFNHLLFDRQLLYSTNKTSNDKINRISNQFWDRWRHE